MATTMTFIVDPHEDINLALKTIGKYGKIEKPEIVDSSHANTNGQLSPYRPGNLDLLHHGLQV